MNTAHAQADILIARAKKEERMTPQFKIALLCFSTVMVAAIGTVFFGEAIITAALAQ